MTKRKFIMDCIYLYEKEKELENCRREVEMLNNEIEFDKTFDVSKYDEKEQENIKKYMESHLVDRHNKKITLRYLEQYVEDKRKELDNEGEL